ncbi:hypothetical protein ROA7450_01690 [Roseovarius albus]|uniref:Uncharacterized protein n=1 Tax=Roseovarius albus TaxID=1247867 RepID=A0A1X6YZ39_9RHOB|nr:hypothetical protein ROA7450_01690 [Roseovarius albus]
MHNLLKCLSPRLQAFVLDHGHWIKIAIWLVPFAIVMMLLIGKRATYSVEGYERLPIISIVSSFSDTDSGMEATIRDQQGNLYVLSTSSFTQAMQHTDTICVEKRRLKNGSLDVAWVDQRKCK